MAAIRGGPLGSLFGLFAAAARRVGFLCIQSGQDLGLHVHYAHHTRIHMRVMLDPLDFNADLSPTAENSVFYFSCMRAADLYLYFYSIRQH